MNRISFFLQNLSLREQILFLIFLALFGIFLGFKSYEGFLKGFFNEIVSFNEQDLSEKIEQRAVLRTEQTELKEKLELQKQELDFYQNKMQLFSLNDENYLNKLNQLIQKYGLNIKDLQSIENEQKYFKKYDLTLQIQGEFKSLLEFIQNLENLNYKLNRIEFENSTSLKLILKINFSLIKLKDY